MKLNVTDYPLTWDEFIGQDRAKKQLRMAVQSAISRKAPMDHVLLASGVPGIGKTALAMLISSELCRPMLAVSGRVDANAARVVLMGMEDNSILFIDEIHRLVQGGKSHAEWLLHLLQDGAIVGPRGPERMPPITVIAATTDIGRLPETIVSRFPIRPVLEPYSEKEAREIVQMMAYNSKIELTEDELTSVARAGNCNPRRMSSILRALRDQVEVHDETNIDEALEWMGITPDGLDDLAQRYLLALVFTFNGQAGVKPLEDALYEGSGNLEITERLLMDRGLLVRERTGRTPTQAGIRRAHALKKAQD